MAESEIISRAPEALELEGVPTDELKKELRHALGITEAAIIRVACLWQELTRRGEDLSEFRFSLSPFLPLVAQGRVSAKLIVEMAGQPRALQRVAELPVSVQNELLSGAKINIYRDGRVEQKVLSSMTFSEISSTIQGGRILTKDEQMRTVKGSKCRQTRIVVKEEDGIIEIGGKAVSLESILEALRSSGILEDVSDAS